MQVDNQFVALTSELASIGRELSRPNGRRERDYAVRQGSEMVNKCAIPFVDQVIDVEIRIGSTKGLNDRRSKDDIPYGTEPDHQCASHRL